MAATLPSMVSLAEPGPVMVIGVLANSGGLFGNGGTRAAGASLIPLLASVIVPGVVARLSAASKTMVSAPAAPAAQPLATPPTARLRFAADIAMRSVHFGDDSVIGEPLMSKIAPVPFGKTSSARLLTVIVPACVNAVQRSEQTAIAATFDVGRTNARHMIPPMYVRAQGAGFVRKAS